MKCKKNIFLLACICQFILVIGQDSELKKLTEQIRTFKIQQEYDSVLSYSDILLKKSQETNAIKFIISAYSYKASVYNVRGKTKEAIENYYNALKLCSDSSFDKQRIFLYNNLGVINFEQKNVALAKDFFKKEIELKRSLGMLKPLASSLINLSSVYRGLQEYDSSAMALNETANLLSKINDDETLGFYYNSFGTHYQLLYRKDSLSNYLDSATNYYNRALLVWKKTNNMAEAFRPLFNLGAIYQSKKEYQKALHNYLLALKVTDSLGLLNDKNKVLGNLSEVYFDLKDYRKAAETFRNYIELKDTLQKEELNAYAIELDKQFQSEKNRETIRQQQLEIAERDLEIEKQNKKVYLALFIIALVTAIGVIIFIYLRFQKSVAEKIDEAKRKFFSNVVHEIRTPLSMIQAPLKVLKAKHTSADDTFNIEMAERNITRLNDLVNQMLAISKLETTRYVFNETFGDIDVFLQQMIQHFAKVASEKNIILFSTLNIMHKVVKFDKDALEKIISNLLSNAIKYTPEGKQVGIDVFTTESEKGIEFTFSVWDTGKGIPEQDQQKIFNRFYRSAHAAEESKGIGIGLSLVKDLVQELNGSIELKSELKKGSVFTVHLTLGIPEEENNTANLTEEINEDKPTILLVEDDDEILKFNSNYLRGNGLNVLLARNGKEALNLLEKTLPDLIISDLMMPELDGLELLKAVRSNEAINHIPFIVLSAKASGESRISTLNEGAQAHLTKPFIPDELFAIVKNQLDILKKRKSDFKEQIEKPTLKVEEKYVGNEPYTKKLLAIIFQQLDNPDLTVEALADLMATNRSHFQRKVKSLIGISPSELIRTIRLEKAKEYLLAKEGNVTEVAYQTGFSSQSYFTKCFTQHFGESPTTFLQKKKK